MKKLMENPIENLIETNQNICAICGRNISGRTSRDHVFPRAIYKWSEEYLTSEEYLDLKGRIESPDNIVLTYPDCNYEKEDDLPDVEALQLPQIKHSGLISVEKGISEAAGKMHVSCAIDAICIMIVFKPIHSYISIE